MIWLILVIIALATALALVSPLTSLGKKPVIILFLMGGILLSSLGLYAVLGTPTPPLPSPPASAVEAPDINAMVNGLAERLKADPDDAEGWARLIRSRIVMGDVNALIRDHKAMRTYYADQPEVIAVINQQSGFDELTTSLEK